MDLEAEAYDVAVIGGGAAGLSAALVLGRARRRVVVVDAGSPRNAPAAHFQGETEDAVVAFQRDAGINIDGQVGEETWKALFGS